MLPKTHPWTGKPISLRARIGDAAVGALPTILALAILAWLITTAHADDYQCTSSKGCTAIISTDTGTRTVVFRKGDIVSTSQGWIVLPGGWSRVDFDRAIAGLLPLCR